ncbi:hypothetical protein [Roseibium aggregatum]|uniref:Uncharacterized protein n=1 Tax=Roseibium aggregatum TaxID=187304 RepID=A0A939EH09_9HYPH|nr:hypothetical protein [Roseibium aggregatum]MBN9672980.1 hypothetical protein [Roseibium aggregatum]
MSIIDDSGMGRRFVLDLNRTLHLSTTNDGMDAAFAGNQIGSRKPDNRLCLAVTLERC